MRVPVRGSIMTPVAQPLMENGGTKRASWPRALAAGALADLLRSPEPVLDITLEQAMPESMATRYAAKLNGAQKYRLILPSTATLPRLLEELAAVSCSVREINFGQHNLEQVFMRLTNRSLRD